MLIVVVLVALAVGPDLEPPGWATVVTFAVQVVHCLPRTRRLRGWVTLAVQAAVFPWADLPGFLAGSVLLVVPRRARWVVFGLVAVAAGLLHTSSVYDCVNAVGNSISQGLVIFALTRLDELRAELHAGREQLAAESVAAARERASGELESSLGTALVEVMRLAGQRDPARIAVVARAAADRVRARPRPVSPPPPADLPPRLMLPTMVLVHAVYLGVATVYLVQMTSPGPRLAGDLAVLAVVVALQLYHSLPRPPGVRPRPVLVTLPVQVALACLALFPPGPPHPQLVGLAAGAVLILLPARFSWPTAVVLLLAAPAALLARGVPVVAVSASTVDTTGMALIFYGIAVTTRVVQEVRRTRYELAAIAVARERRRIAQDVHDLLGYGVSAIAVKAELAARAPDPSERDLEEIVAIARNALADLRAIPHEGPIIRLDDELSSARDVLAAAGTSPSVRVGHGQLPGHVDELLATVLREAVTNVLRHSRARRCLIETSHANGEVVLRVTNDRTAATEATGATVVRDGHGQGLDNLATRVGEHGGSLTTRAEPAEFELRVRQPVGA